MWMRNFIFGKTLAGWDKGEKRCIIKSQFLKGHIYFKEPNPRYIGKGIMKSIKFRVIGPSRKEKK